MEGQGEDKEVYGRVEWRVGGIRKELRKAAAGSCEDKKGDLSLFNFGRKGVSA